MAISVALLVIGVAGGLNSITFDTGQGGFWNIFQLGLLCFIVTLAVWFKQTIQENRAGMNSAQLKHSYVLGMQWFIFSEVMFFACFFGTLFYVRKTMPFRYAIWHMWVNIVAALMFIGVWLAVF